MLRNLMIFIACMAATACKGDDNVAQKDSAVFNVENVAVRYVMAQSDAQFGPKASCIPQAFFDDSLAYRPDQPNAKTVAFACAAADKAVVSLARGENGSQTVFSETVQLQDGKGSYAFTNLVPGETYRYAVTVGDTLVVAQGTFTTTGQVRMLAIDGGFNIRDLGGWKGLDGTTVRYRLLYRGGSLGGTDMSGNRSDITAEGKAELVRLGIGAQLDLRAATDGGKYSGEGSLHSYSAGEAPLPSLDFNNTMSDYGAYNGDQSIVSDVAWIIYELRRGRPVYFNCRQGADRTGTVAFVLEGLLGCYEYANDAGGNQMALDYELTGFSQANRIDNWKVATSCRPASEAYANTDKLFRKLLDLEAAEPDVKLATLQQKCYYYLNRYVNPEWKGTALHIDSADLDWFITTALNGMTASRYTAFRPAWAAEGAPLKDVAEQCANVVRYAEDASAKK